MNGFLPDYEFDEPAVVLSAIGARCGKCFFAEGKWASLANTQVIFPDPARADAKFLWYQLNDERRWHRSGTGQPFIKPADVKAQRVVLPPLPEQRRIAEILDKADALRAKRRAALAQLDTLTQSIFLDMFGDPATNPKGWPVRTFDETIRDETSQAEKLQRSDYLPEGRYPVVDQGQSVIAGYCDDDQYLCRSELPVVVFGDHTRAVKLVRHPFVVGADGAKVLAPRPGVDAAFLSWLLRELPIPDLGYSRHMREVKRLAFPVPPIDRQTEFAQRIGGVELHRAAHDRSRLELDALFASLQYRAFRGLL
jgi:type I restriction enzyme S subunit